MIEITRNISRRDVAERVRHVMRTLPLKVGETVVKFSMNRFAEQNWVDNGTTPWRARKPGTKNNRGRSLLIKSGRLRRSVRIKNLSADSVTVWSDVPYAKAHNEGFKAGDGQVVVRKHLRRRFAYSKEKYTTKTGKSRTKTVQSIAKTFTVREHVRMMKMPQRKFLGESAYQTRQLERMIQAEILKAMR